MPYAYVTYDPSRVSDEQLDTIAKHLPRTVVDQLTVPGRPLTERQIDVLFSEFHTKDVTTRDMQVVVQAGRYQERLAIDLNAAAGRIAQSIQQQCCGADLRVAVWIQLVDGGFFESP